MAQDIVTWAKKGNFYERGKGPNRHIKPLQTKTLEAPPFELGTTRPDVATYNTQTLVGPRKGLASLQNYEGDITNVAVGEVVKDLYCTGRWLPNNTGATLRDSFVAIGDPGSVANPTINTPSQKRPRRGLDMLTDNRTHNFEYVEVKPSVLSYDVSPAQGGNFVMSHCNIWGSADGVMAHGSSGQHKTARLEACWIHDIQHYPIDPGHGPEGSHDDGVQIEGNVDIEIVGCYITGGSTSVIMVTNNVAGGYGHLRLLDNWFVGHPTSGSCVNLAAANIGANLEVKRNRITKTSVPGILVSLTNRTASRFGCVGADGSTSAWTAGPDANVWDDGTFCRPQNG